MSTATQFSGRCGLVRRSLYPDSISQFACRELQQCQLFVFETENFFLIVFLSLHTVREQNVSSQPLHPVHDPERLRQDVPVKVQHGVRPAARGGHPPQPGPRAQPRPASRHRRPRDHAHALSPRVRQRGAQPRPVRGARGASARSAGAGVVAVPAVRVVCRPGLSH
jgi:hypothetical protein